MCSAVKEIGTKKKKILFLHMVKPYSLCNIKCGVMWTWHVLWDSLRCQTDEYEYLTSEIKGSSIRAYYVLWTDEYCRCTFGGGVGWGGTAKILHPNTLLSIPTSGIGGCNSSQAVSSWMTGIVTQQNWGQSVGLL